MFQSLDLFGLSCLFLTITCKGGQILQPQNVSLVWLSEFVPQLSWAHPQDSMENCQYRVDWVNEGEKFDVKMKGTVWESTVHMKDGRFFNVSVRTVCGSNESLPVYKSFAYPELVKDLQCNIHTSEYTCCSWIPVSPHSPSFFYRLVNEGGVNDLPTTLQACSPCTDTDNGRTGCSMRAKHYYSIHIVLNETRDNETYKNTFNIQPKVKPPALNWTVTKAKDKFLINWTELGVGSGWRYIINYTECNENKTKDVSEDRELAIVPHCPYTIRIQAESSEWSTPWTDPCHFVADTNSNVLLAAAIITPLLIGSLAVLLFVCWRKNKNSIFPKVPKPRDLLSDISDNNNKSNVPNLYIPAEEEESCKITLVVDPPKKLT